MTDKEEKNPEERQDVDPIHAVMRKFGGALSEHRPTPEERKRAKNRIQQ